MIIKAGASGLSAAVAFAARHDCEIVVSSRAALERHEALIKELEKQLRAAVTASGTTLTEIQGIEFLTAAKILALSALGQILMVESG